MEKQLSEIQKTLWKNKKFLALIVASILILAFASSLNLSITGTSFNQGTQGLNFNFNSVQTPSGSIVKQGTTLDYQASGGPVIGGTIGPFTVNTDTSNNKVYMWSIQNGTTTDNYQANLVECSMSFNIFESGNGAEAGPSKNFGLPTLLDSPTNYNGYNIWLKITPQSAIPFANNPSVFYIAPAYIGLTSSVNWGISSTGGSGAPSISVAQINGAEETSPMAQGDVFAIYYAVGGQPVSLSTTATFQGQPLSPVLFQNQYYIALNLQRLVAVNSYGLGGLLGHNWAFPTGTFHLTVYVWVVGEWVTYFTPGQLPIQVQHATQFGSSTTVLGGIANAINGILSNPLDVFLILLLIVGAGVIILIVFFPELAKALSGAASRKINSGAAKKKSG